MPGLEDLYMPSFLVNEDQDLRESPSLGSADKE